MTALPLLLAFAATPDWSMAPATQVAAPCPCGGPCGPSCPCKDGECKAKTLTVSDLPSDRRLIDGRWDVAVYVSDDCAAGQRWLGRRWDGKNLRWVPGTADCPSYQLQRAGVKVGVYPTRWGQEVCPEFRIAGDETTYQGYRSAAFILSILQAGRAAVAPTASGGSGGGAKPAAVTTVATDRPAAVAGRASTIAPVIVETPKTQGFSTSTPLQLSSADSWPLVPRDPRPGHWSYPGSLDDHLRRAHGIEPAGMTREQKLTAHDLAHERGWRPSLPSVPRYVSPAPRYVVRACPGGRCP